MGKRPKKEDGYLIDEFMVAEDDSLSEYSYPSDKGTEKRPRSQHTVTNGGIQNKCALQIKQDLDDLVGPDSDKEYSDGSEASFAPGGSPENGSDSESDHGKRKKKGRPVKKDPKAPLKADSKSVKGDPTREILKKMGVKRYRSPTPDNAQSGPYYLTPPKTPATKRARTGAVAGSAQPKPIIHNDELQNKAPSVYKELLNTFGIGNTPKRT